MPTPSLAPSRRDRSRGLRRLVPEEVAAAHERVRTAARQPGISEPAAAIDAADGVLLEVAALLAGRAPDEAQAGFVAARAAYLDDLALALEERGAAWHEAAGELDLLTPIGGRPEDAPTRDGALVNAFVVALSPFFLVWDLVRGVGHAAVALVDGVERLLRSAVATVVTLVRGIGSALLAAVRRWRTHRARIVAAAREARARMIAARLRVRLRLRRRLRPLRRAPGTMAVDRSARRS